VSRLALILPFLLSSACLGLRDFPSESIVDSPRVLAVVVEPPEVTPGHAVAITPLVAHARDVEVEYRICGTFDGPTGGAQFGEMEDEDCGERALLRGSGPTWNVPLAATEAFWANTELAGTILGGALPAEAIDAVRYSVGLPLLVELTVQADGQELHALKRVLMSENAAPHTNPPPPRFKFGDSEVQADPASAWTCRADEPLRVEPGAEVEIAPATEDGREPWLEHYQVIDAFGTREERSERAFYSWFATGGHFETHTTRAPLRNQVWTAPDQPGSERLWLVVRDGHGGTSACRWDVLVEANPAPNPARRAAAEPQTL
jgi:hypothetical protein